MDRKNGFLQKRPRPARKLHQGTSPLRDSQLPLPPESRLESGVDFRKNGRRCLQSLETLPGSHRSAPPGPPAGRHPLQKAAGCRLHWLPTGPFTEKGSAPPTLAQQVEVTSPGSASSVRPPGHNRRERQEGRPRMGSGATPVTPLPGCFAFFPHGRRSRRSHRSRRPGGRRPVPGRPEEPALVPKLRGGSLQGKRSFSERSSETEAASVLASGYSHRRTRDQEAEPERPALSDGDRIFGKPGRRTQAVCTNSHTDHFPVPKGKADRNLCLLLCSLYFRSLL